MGKLVYPDTWKRSYTGQSVSACDGDGVQINNYGEVVSEATYRLNTVRQDTTRQQQTDVLARSLELEAVKRANMRRRLDEMTKIELVCQVSVADFMSSRRTPR